MEKFKVAYIDDNPDPALSEYLDIHFKPDDYEIEHVDITFAPEGGYASLLENQDVTSANIILIDSRLFENHTDIALRFTGEEFKLILRKVCPFIEVIIVTQYDVALGIDKITKYKYDPDTSAIEYYDGLLPNCLGQAVNIIRQYRILAEQVQQNNTWDELLKERVISSLNGKQPVYDELTKSDIDELIDIFNDIQVKLNG